jgi:mRNA interferase MazF
VKREPERGELYYANLGIGVGNEQGQRPMLVISIDPMNRAPAELVLAVPLTTSVRPTRIHVRIEPERSGLERISYAMPEMLRHISTARLGRRIGRAPLEAVDVVARRSGVLIGLGRTRF